MKKSTRLLITSAAIAGLYAGAFAAKTYAADTMKPEKSGTADTTKKEMPADKHDCAGKNGCAGKGGCRTSDKGCRGKNSCSGKGGCSTMEKAKPADKPKA